MLGRCRLDACWHSAPALALQLTLYKLRPDLMGGTEPPKLVDVQHRIIGIIGAHATSGELLWLRSQFGELPPCTRFRFRALAVDGLEFLRSKV